VPCCAAGAPIGHSEGGRRRVDVPGRARGRPGDLLGRDVPQRARGDRPVAGARGQAEVGQLARAAPVDQHILRLVVTVHDAALVRGGQSQQRTLQHDQGRLGRGRALVGEDLTQRDPLDELHHDRGAVRRLDVLIQPDHVRVLDRRQRGRLAAEHLGEHRVAQQVGAQVLDRDQHAGGVVTGKDDPAEPAGAEVFELRVAGNGPLGHRDPLSSSA